MARKVRPPQYCLHKGSGQAYTRINGRMIYLGEHNSAESRSKYAEVISDWSAGNLDKFGQQVSIARLAVAYTKHAETYYVKNGRQTSHVDRIRTALKMLVEHFGSLPADRFTPPKMEQLQRKYLELGLSRKTITDYVNIVRQAFRFAVTKGNISPTVWQGLLAVRHLQKGRSSAREPKPILPVSPVDVIKTLRELGPVVGAMVRLQYLTGMRPGEVCSMRLVDLDRSQDVWIYRPESHKTEHHGRSRQILLGRKAQGVLTPFLNRTEDSFLFSPTQTCELRAGKATLRLAYQDSYTSTTYCRAVTRATEKASARPWTPNRLRHTYATIIRKRYGLEAAQILLGHSKADVTQVYAERDWQKAEQVVREVG